MTISEFDAARVALARKHNQEPAFINSLLVIYLRHYANPETLRGAIEMIDEELTPKETA